MRRLALSWGDQPYGAVLVTAGGLVAEGPSRVVKHADPNAHAEREAIREAQRRLGTMELEGSVLYSTSRPCRLCEQAAAQAKVSRMFFGPELVTPGLPACSLTQEMPASFAGRRSSQRIGQNSLSSGIRGFVWLGSSWFWQVSSRSDGPSA